MGDACIRPRTGDATLASPAATVKERRMDESSGWLTKGSRRVIRVVDIEECATGCVSGVPVDAREGGGPKDRMRSEEGWQDVKRRNNKT